MNNSSQPLWKLLSILYKPHPWHGISAGEAAPDVINCFVEVVPSDTMKYEIDKVSGYLKLDRPQKYSSMCPALYGFMPQTFCGESVAAYSSQATGRELEGDGDPLDVLHRYGPADSARQPDRRVYSDRGVSDAGPRGS
jgi:inorganic pyrophosphatase